MKVTLFDVFWTLIQITPMTYGQKQTTNNKPFWSHDRIIKRKFDCLGLGLWLGF